MPIQWTFRSGWEITGNDLGSKPYQTLWDAGCRRWAFLRGAGGTNCRFFGTERGREIHHVEDFNRDAGADERRREDMRIRSARRHDRGEETGRFRARIRRGVRI